MIFDHIQFWRDSRPGVGTLGLGHICEEQIVSALTGQHKLQMRRKFLWTVSIVGAAVAFATPNDASGVSTKVGPVRSVSDFKQAIYLASRRNKAALIDVGAEWCEFCHMLDGEIFVDPRVASLLSKLAFIRVDATAMGPSNIELLSFLNVPGPPTLFVIDTSSSKEFPQTRSVGAFAGKRFRSSLSYLTCGLLLRFIAARGGWH